MEIPKILLPIIRKVDPAVLASHLIGVQPMSGSLGSIFSLRPTYGPSKIQLGKHHYRHFLRLNNRRKTHDPSYITSCGYPTIKVSRRNDKALDAKSWCDHNLDNGSFIYHSGQFWFADDRHFMIFSLRWA